MDIVKKIKAVSASQDVSMRDIASSLGMSPQAWYQRLKTGKFTSYELEQIATALGCKYYFGFELPDGTKI